MRSRAANASRLAALLVVAGCSVDATGVLVTLKTNGANVESINVTVTKSQGGAVLATHPYPGPIADGATFGIRVADSEVNVEITIRVDAMRGGQVVCRGLANALPQVKHKAAMATVDLTSCAVNADMTLPPDMALPGDMLPPDLTMPGTCTPSCGNGTAMLCVNGKPQMVFCPWGCKGAACSGPTACNAAGDISSPGVYAADTSVGNAITMASCQNVVGPTNVFKFSSSMWAKWTISVAAQFPATLFSSFGCQPLAEVMKGGECEPGAVLNACDKDNAMVTQTLCGLPPGTLLPGLSPVFAFVEHAGGMGGPYTITTTSKPVDRNTCATAGMLPGASITVMDGDTTNQKAMMQAIGGTPLCGDLGAAAPEVVFWVPVRDSDAGKKLTITVTSTSALDPLVYVQTNCRGVTPCAAAMNGTATWTGPIMMGQVPYVFVDGNNGTKGTFNLSMTLK